MKIITKTANPSGAYPPIQSGASSVPEGYALWPETLDAAVFYEYNGFVVLTFEEVDGVPTVSNVEPNAAAREEWKSALPETELTPEEQREQAYNTEKVISWGGDSLSVTEAAALWSYYAAEGSDKAAELTALIAKAKADIREGYPDVTDEQESVG